MKKITIISFLTILLNTSFVFGITKDHPKMSEYLSKRYVTITTANIYTAMLDMKDVAAVIYTVTSHFSDANFSKSNPAVGTWIVLKNGTKIFTGSNAPTNATAAYDAYIQFLKDNPEFRYEP